MIAILRRSPVTVEFTSAITTVEHLLSRLAGSSSCWPQMSWVNVLQPHRQSFRKRSSTALTPTCTASVVQINTSGPVVQSFSENDHQLGFHIHVGIKGPSMAQHMVAPRWGGIYQYDASPTLPPGQPSVSFDLQIQVDERGQISGWIQDGKHGIPERATTFKSPRITFKKCPECCLSSRKWWQHQ